MILSLAEAIRTDRLAEFVNEQELGGIGSIDGAAFDNAAASFIKAPQSGDPTSHSSSADGLKGKNSPR